MELILLKHGETLEGKKDIILGQLGGNLSPKGKIESKKIAKVIRKRKKLKPRLIISSDLKRTKQTAQTISKMLHLPIRYDRLIRERHAGTAQGKPENKIDWELYEKKPLSRRKHLGGESFSDVKKRAKLFLKKMRKEDARAIVVSHSVFILMMVAEFYKIPIQKALKLPLENRLYIIDAKKNGRLLRPFFIKLKN